MNSSTSRRSIVCRSAGAGGSAAASSMPPGLMPRRSSSAQSGVYCLAGIPRIASSDPNELPSRTLQITLAGHVLFVAVRPMPFVAIAFDRKAPLHPLDHQIDAIPMIGGVADADLGTHVEPFATHEVKNVPLELGIEFWPVAAVTRRPGFSM